DLLSQSDGTNTRFYHFDARGDTRQLTDESETVTDSWTYDAWGNILSRTGTTPTPFQFVGKLGYQYDALIELNYLRARWYETAMGRWESLAGVFKKEKANNYAVTRALDLLPSGGPEGSFFSTIASVDSVLEIRPDDHPRHRLDPTCRDLKAIARWVFFVPKWPCRTEYAFFVQNVRFHSLLCSCDETTECNSPHGEYWEAWAVCRPGAKVCYPGFKRSLSAHDTASYQIKGQDKGRGSYRQSGTTKFFCLAPSEDSVQSGEIPPSAVSQRPGGVVDPGGSGTSTGILWFVKEEPSWWKEPGITGNVVKRHFRMQWNCCCRGNDPTASARP
ncbi:MAG: hypothetical protein KDA91_25305, partial [Planctomycetaceae bacterium]|nr:hypothetical protein [Planctomycetaceae bacterium]